MCPHKGPRHPMRQTPVETGVGGTELWRISTCRRRQVCVIWTDYPTRVQNSKRFLVSTKPLYEEGELLANLWEPQNSRLLAPELHVGPIGVDTFSTNWTSVRIKVMFCQMNAYVFNLTNWQFQYSFIRGFCNTYIWFDFFLIRRNTFLHQKWQMRYPTSILYLILPN